MPSHRSTTSHPHPAPAAPSLRMRGGVPALFIPFAVMLTGILILGFAGLAVPEAFWPMVLLGLLVGLVLARSQKAYVEALVAGIASPMLAVILLAWFLAGIFGRVLNETGVIEGLIWAATSAGLAAAWVPLVAFGISGVLSLSTGTSIGTILAVTPVLFPAGFAIGADPLLLAGAIIGGAFVGDNLAPVSDTTIVSAYSQGTDVPKVVRSRLKYAAVAGAATVLLYVVLGFVNSGGTSSGDAIDAEAGGLVMLLAPLLLIILMIRQWHFVASLLVAIAFGLTLGLVTGRLEFADLLSVDSETYETSGVIVSGIQGFVGIAVFTILLMGLIGTFRAGGLLDWLMEKSRRFATTPRRAETAIVGVGLGVNALTTAGTPTMVMLGPWTRRIGHSFRIAPWRRGNLLDGASTSIIGFLPWSVAVLIPIGLVGSEVRAAGETGFDAVSIVPFVFYCWALMLVMIGAAVTGWGRETMDDASWRAEEAVLAAESAAESVADGGADGGLSTPPDEGPGGVGNR
ncbi:Na+/H+ antiporter NhaC family protein [Phytoactinopolyspora limicola]|uniref:Na+/H+ antiporter NhaC family protein n=1 Tax=Phytoactinopolyspora limicola TaxID=2715536 RepID=UPI00140CA40F|nr:Na+/H+ antiporter NhaC family protein [Phytoactinopolyspora limicola]